MVRFRSKSSAMGWTGAGADTGTGVDIATSDSNDRKLKSCRSGDQMVLRSLLATVHDNGYDFHRYDFHEPDRRPCEDHDAGALDVTARPAARGAGVAASGRGESAVHDGVLLQGAVGASTG